MSTLKQSIDTMLQELAGLSKLADVLAAAAEVRDAITDLEKKTSQLCLLLVARGEASVASSERSVHEAVERAIAKPSAYDLRKNAPARAEVSARILNKLKKEERMMSQAELIRTLHHDYYSVAASLRALVAAGELRAEMIPLNDGSKRKVKAYYV